jgi:hypothetical protein
MPQLGFSVAMRTNSAAISGLVRGRPGWRVFESSYFLATSFRYQRRMVSGVTIPVMSARRRRPRTLPFTAKRRRWSSVRHSRRAPCAARRTREENLFVPECPHARRNPQGHRVSSRCLAPRDARGVAGQRSRPALCGTDSADRSRGGGPLGPNRRRCGGGQISAPGDRRSAATALDQNLTLVTRNTQDIAVTGVPVFNPWSS